MEQLTQNLKTGDMRLLEVPYPALQKGCVLVKNHYSLISAGTESKTVGDARLGMVGKANARKDEVKKVIDSVRSYGLKDTYKMVMNKLDAPSPLGYSCAGEVIAVADDVAEFRAGDHVACGGNTANHAEIISAPENLCVKIEASVSLKEASFTTLGAVALQGIRQADLRLGENAVVIGLGLVGQLTLQLLRAGGIKAIGIDTDSKQVQLAETLGFEAFQRNKENLDRIILQHTDGYGSDAVIITAGTTSSDPVDLAGVLCRKKGKVVIVGNVSTGFNRNNYFKKELDLRMSSSYGPGRYDKKYEDKGLDYPIAYVRWTENRNMRAFAELLKDKKINIDKLVTHVFDFKDAPKAYRLILDKEESFAGVVLKYDIANTAENKKIISVSKNHPGKAGISAGVIGAGSFAQNFLLPALKGKINLTGVATARPTNARNIADKYGFSYCTGNAGEILADNSINTVFITTWHNSHADFVIRSLEKNKNVFVEKPLCLNAAELEKIKNQYGRSEGILLVGFNRRFAPHIIKLKSLLKKNNQPIAINYRINAGPVAPDHWTQDKETGGGRVIGEVCHFIDLAQHLTGSRIESVSANAMKDPHNLKDSLVINLSFENGSVAGISYFANGGKELAKEKLEVFCSGQTFVIDDFKTLTTYGRSVRVDKLTKQDKGHKTQMEAFIEAINSGKDSPVSFEEIYHSTEVTFQALESVANKGKLLVN